ncbi:MAG: acyltransferase family protein [Sphingobacteriales bacterium]
MNLYKDISFFKGLNSLRFFAAFLVVMHHTETIRKKNGLENFEWLGLFRNGSTAVTFFFVLSGFLITYLLLKENNKTGTISVKKFYIKRVLRIWPLYFLLVITGTLILPELFSLLNINYEMPYSFGQVWHYFLFFLPGLVTFYFGHHLLEPLWSIGVEEVFYLIWAPLFKFCKRKILPILLSVIIIKIVLSVTGIYFIKNELFNYVVNTFSFEAMAIGGLGAWFIFNRQNSLSHFFLYKKSIQVIIYLLLATYLVFNINIDNFIWNTVFKLPIFSGLVIDFLFLYLIIGVSIIDNSIIKLNSGFLSYLGEISYGIYMYHMLIIFTIILFFKKYLLTMNLTSASIMFYSVLTLTVVGVSAISKLFFENYFLNLKSKIEKKAAHNMILPKLQQ